MLPGMSGYEICKEIRKLDSAIPIMVLSARLTSQDKAHAFDCGADQYVTKPFDLNEVLSRVRNLIHSRSVNSPRRSVDVHDGIFEFGNVKVDCAAYQVIVNGNASSLTLMEMQLLRYFLDHPGVVLSRAKILADVWGYDSDVTTRSIDNFVMRCADFWNLNHPNRDIFSRYAAQATVSFPVLVGQRNIRPPYKPEQASEPLRRGHSLRVLYFVFREVASN